jgi:hypothetical protein
MNPAARGRMALLRTSAALIAVLLFYSDDALN